MGISKWNAGIIRPVPVAPTGPYQNSSAPGVWTIDQQAYWQKQGLWPTAGNVDPSAFIENLFSTYLYSGTGATQTITNGIDLSTKGGLVWIKGRSGATDHALYDTTRGATFDLASNTTAAQTTQATGLTSFGTTGFSVGALAKINTSTATYASWTFREQPKFFDVVTYTGDGTNYRTINHSLGSTPGCVIVKSTSTTGDWAVYHRGSDPKNLILNSTSGAITGQFSVQDVSATSFAVANSSFYGFPQSIPVNDSGQTYVAYLFAHNAGGFGLTGTDNVISCGIYTGNGSANGTLTTLGYEPQWLMIKPASQAGNWFMFNNMQGMPVEGDDNYLFANDSGAENTFNWIAPTATGFYPTQSSTINASGQTYIYIAIRRGPMAVPTLGTSVYAGQLQSPPGGSYTLAANSGFPIDMMISRVTASIQSCFTFTRLQGNEYLATASTAAAGSATYGWDKMAGVTATWDSSAGTVSWSFRRAPGVMDVVCYTGTGSNTTQTHNLGAVPELMIVKRRSAVNAWAVYANNDNTDYLVLNTTAATADDNTYWNDTSPTSSVFSVGTNNAVNASASTYVAYLFATCAGVSKVGSYTGTGALQTVACGFTSGARFVLIKRTDSTGDWYVWDSARGLSSGTDPYLLLNSTAAEVTGTNYVDTDTTGFKVTAAAPAGINANGGTYIFLAIA